MTYERLGKRKSISSNLQQRPQSIDKDLVILYIVISLFVSRNNRNNRNNRSIRNNRKNRSNRTSREKITLELEIIYLSLRDGRFGYKVGQIGPKWDKSEAFSDQISVHLAPI